MNRKTKIIISVIAAAVILAVAVTAIILALGKPADKPDEGTTPSASSTAVPTESTQPEAGSSEESSVTVPPVSSEESSASDTTTIPPEDIVSPNESETAQPQQTEKEPETTKDPEATTVPESTGVPETSKTPETGKKPETTKTPETTQAPETGLHFGGDGETTTAYSCGVPGHHCDCEGIHEFICQLEEAGCEYCGSHNCPSFYAVDKWGSPGYDATLCPQYDIKKDPLYYCQDCGKPTGDGRNGTCVHYIQACCCPNCGKWVESRECHTCE